MTTNKQIKYSQTKIGTHSTAPASLHSNAALSQRNKHRKHTSNKHQTINKHINIQQQTYKQYPNVKCEKKLAPVALCQHFLIQIQHFLSQSIVPYQNGHDKLSSSYQIVMIVDKNIGAHLTLHMLQFDCQTPSQFSPSRQFCAKGFNALGCK